MYYMSPWLYFLVQAVVVGVDDMITYLVYVDWNRKEMEMLMACSLTDLAENVATERM